MQHTLASATRRDFSRAATDYDKRASLQRMVAYRLAEVAKTVFPGKTHLLDIGCGTGFIARALQGHNDIIQCDLSEGMCQEATSVAPVFQCNMETLPLADEAVDGVTSSMALQWSTDPAQLVKETARIIKPDGYCLTSMAIPGSLQEIHATFTEMQETKRLHTFIPETKWVDLFKRNYCSISTETKQYSLFYPDLITALNSIRSIGGMNKNTSRREVLTKSTLEQMSRYYLAHFNTPYGASLTWDILTIVAKK